jgi:hypothetical protein
MRIEDILVESKQLDEGPLSNKIGSAVGTVARGVGAVGGGIVGAGQAIAKGYRAGKAAVASAGDSDDALPTPNSGDYGQLSKDKGKIWNKKSQQWEPYDQSTGAASTANAPQAAGAAPSNAPQAAGAAPSNAPSNAPATTPNIDRSVSTPVKNVADFGTIQRSIKTLSPRQKAALVAQLSIKPARRESTQAEIDADRENIMGTTSDSIIRTANPISESFSLYRKH